MKKLLELINYFEDNIDEAKHEIRYEIELNENKKLYGIKFYRTTFNFFGGPPGSEESSLLEFVVGNYNFYVITEEKVVHEKNVEIPVFYVREHEEW